MKNKFFHSHTDIC